jgi:hypothetical protein
MIQVLQFLNGYGLILIPAILALGAAALLIYRRSRFRWWAAWAAGVTGSVAGLLILPTASGTVIAAVPDSDADASGMVQMRDSLEWDSAESIEKAILASDGKPTLVEFYTDFGIG